MKKFYSIGIIFVLFSIILIGCYTERQIALKNYEPNTLVTKIITIENKLIDFTSDELGFAIIRDDRVERFMKNGDIEYIPLSMVKEAYCSEKINSSSSGYWIILTLIGLIISLSLLSLKYRN